MLDCHTRNFHIPDLGNSCRLLAALLNTYTVSAGKHCEAIVHPLCNLPHTGGLGGVALELNTKGRYAVMAMADLARYGQADAVPLSAIAERQHLSLPYLEQLFLKLRRAGLVESARGRSGGYRLGRPASTISVAEVMSAVEEDMRMTRCHAQAEPGSAGCIGEQRCLTHGLWQALGDRISVFLSEVTLQDVLEGVPMKGPTAATQTRAVGALPMGFPSE